MIYLIRHGQAAAGWGEQPDPGLSEDGRMQAKTVAEWLATEPVNTAISSPMARCQETGRFFAERTGLSLEIEPAVTEIPTPSDVSDRVTWLRDLMTGEWEAAPALVKDWRASLLETLAQVPDQTAVFTHFVAINAIVGHLEQSPSVTVFRPNYCSVTKLEADGSNVRLIERGQSFETKVL